MFFASRDKDSETSCCDCCEPGAARCTCFCLAGCALGALAACGIEPAALDPLAAVAAVAAADAAPPALLLPRSTPTATSVPCHSFFSRDRDRHLPSACSPLALLPTRHAAVPSPLPLLPPALAPQPPAPPTLCFCCCHRRLCRCHCLYPFSLTASPTPAPKLTSLPAPSHAPPLP